MAVHYTLEPMLFPSDKTEEFNQFMDEYGTKSDRYIWNQIAKVKTNVDQKTIEKYINNLDLIAKTNDLITDNHLKRIERVKRILLSNTSAPPQEIESQWFGFGVSLLLWFLILVIIWRQPCCPPKDPCHPGPCSYGTSARARVGKTRSCRRYTFDSRKKKS
ncbi:MAG: hypothetical protein N4A57_09235 [Anaeromicrobium sp.]|jgi:hypothetical protein|uniref:hypothetical protein n=1 Tax=Anaeromicrobium sp. TaxID=1929132 RepID=UPI0025E12122|nr:hypothetical protein [Anaeromicrobium sp.]MCT4594436.1 hypothetical protein [Anaeromicrobium sp.]